MGFYLVAASCSYSSCGAQTLIAMASRCGARAMEHRLNSCAAWAYGSVAGEIFADEGSNPRLLQWQADSLPLSH